MYFPLNARVGVYCETKGDAIDSSAQLKLTIHTFCLIFYMFAAKEMKFSK